MRRTSMGFLSRDALATQISVAGWVMNDCFVMVYEFGADGFPGAVFYPGVAEGFEFAGVDEDVEGGEGVGELGAGLRAEEVGGGEEFAEVWFEGAGADDGEGGVGEVGDGSESVEAFFGGEAADVSDDAVGGVGLVVVGVKEGGVNTSTPVFDGGDAVVAEFGDGAGGGG